MRDRKVLTMLWIGSLLLAIGIVEAYFLRTTASGIAFLLPGERVEAYKCVAIVYGPTIGAILGCVFLRPFPIISSEDTRRFLFGLALVLSATYNLIVLYLLAQGHFSQTEHIGEILHRTQQIAIAFAFIVTPVNGYYFGVKALA
jgi:hypothetical protein